MNPGANPFLDDQLILASIRLFKSSDVRLEQALAAGWDILVVDEAHHLAWSPEEQTLTAFRDVCWYSWPEQTRSMERLLGYRFEWVLPGHGRIHHASADEMHAHLERCVAWMKGRRRAAGRVSRSASFS